MLYNICYKSYLFYLYSIPWMVNNIPKCYIAQPVMPDSYFWWRSPGWTHCTQCLCCPPTGQSRVAQPALVTATLDSLFAFDRPAPLRVACSLVRARYALLACHSVLLMPTSLTVVAVDVVSKPSNLPTPLSVSSPRAASGPAGWARAVNRIRVISVLGVTAERDIRGTKTELSVSYHYSAHI